MKGGLAVETKKREAEKRERQGGMGSGEKA